MLPDWLLTHIPADRCKRHATQLGRFPGLPIPGPSTTLRLPGQHHLGWNRKAAASFTALGDETQLSPEPEAYVNVWF